MTIIRDICGRCGKPVFKEGPGGRYCFWRHEPPDPRYANVVEDQFCGGKKALGQGTASFCFPAEGAVAIRDEIVALKATFVSKYMKHVFMCVCTRCGSPDIATVGKLSYQCNGCGKCVSGPAIVFDTINFNAGTACTWEEEPI